MRDGISVRPSGWQIASRAWRSVFQAMARMPGLFVSAFVLFLLLYICSRWLQRPLPHTRLGWAPLAFDIARNLVSSLLAAPVAVAVHRWVLLNDIQPGLSWKPAYTRLFFFWALVLHLFYMLTALAVPMLIYQTRTGAIGQLPHLGVVLLSIVLMLVVTVVSAYLALVFPDVAIGEPSASWIARVKASIARLRGNFWLLVRAAILAFLPITAINVIVFLTVTRFYDRYPVSKYWFGPVALGQTLADSAMVLFSIGIAAATVSWLYSWARTEKTEVTSG